MRGKSLGKAKMAAMFSRGVGGRVWRRILAPANVNNSRSINRQIARLDVVSSRSFGSGFERRKPELNRLTRTASEQRVKGLLWLRYSSVYGLGARGYSSEIPNITSDAGSSASELLQDSAPPVVNPFIPEGSQLDNITTGTDLITDVADTVTSLGEPAITSLGLGGYTPIGLVQHSLEFLHVTVNLPWVWSIVAATVAFRLLMFPLIVKSQANAARLNNVKPKLEEIQAQLRELMNTNNAVGKAAASHKLQQLYKEHNCHPVKSVIAPLIQAPLFISFFIGLRRMANLPVESLKTGGLFWFTDLTAYDPYFVLPVVCSLTMLASIELGGEAGVSNPQMQNMKQFFRVMCVIMIPMTAQFPTAIFAYWVTSNFFSLGQVSLLKLKAVREYFGIPEMKVHENLEAQGGFWENMKAGYTNSQETAHVKHHEKMKRQKAKALGTAPLEPTYENNPRIKHNQEVFSAASKKKKSKGGFKDRAGPPM